MSFLAGRGEKILVEKMPVLFVGHGSPMNAIEHNAFTKTLEGLSADLPKPKAVCVVSAHWVTHGSHVLASPHPKTIHDFYGFPRPLYEVQYPAPGAPSEAKKLASNPEIVPDHQWGLDHGSWSVLRHMYPNADVPAFQLSLDERRSFKEHLELGREIQSLRERGVLILGSGNIVHNLGRIDWDRPSSAYDWAVEFDTNVKAAVEAHDVQALAEPQEWGESLLANAHPTVEHYLPLLYCMGSTDEGDTVSYPYEGFDFGSISMRMILFGPAISRD
ncbi:MAG TPA: 4,5-DOPA dioxygenase extradiol [Candidatus Sulfotelmatobacter sp.]|nr:4,5-DOPA dioxygenase extradiol [Candidatus Sulfotelmatobacter sp.]